MTTACAYEKSCSNFLNKSILQHFYLWQKYISIKQVQYELYIASTLYDLLRRNTKIKKNHLPIDERFLLRLLHG